MCTWKQLGPHVQAVFSNVAAAILGVVSFWRQRMMINNLILETLLKKS